MGLGFDFKERTEGMERVICPFPKSEMPIRRVEMKLDDQPFSMAFLFFLKSQIERTERLPLKMAHLGFYLLNLIGPQVHLNHIFSVYKNRASEHWRDKSPELPICIVSMIPRNYDKFLSSF
ncbi:MAG: hypothetical protein EAX81_07180 [Candidatus Thorarchaeota archaeon]|nr:hypothetical protein [Candidatus Thorarchaeota archaeon]